MLGLQMGKVNGVNRVPAGSLVFPVTSEEGELDGS